MYRVFFVDEKNQKTNYLLKTIFNLPALLTSCPLDFMFWYTPLDFKNFSLYYLHCRVLTPIITQQEKEN
jgi:ABC-type multidrug transport system permease subunit